jgi:hypothetical protein
MRGIGQETLGETQHDRRKKIWQKKENYTKSKKGRITKKEKTKEINRM